MTPASLFSLLEIHNKVNSVEDDNEYSKPKEKVEQLTLEEALAWAGKR